MRTGLASPSGWASGRMGTLKASTARWVGSLTVAIRSRVGRPTGPDSGLVDGDLLFPTLERQGFEPSQRVGIQRDPRERDLRDRLALPFELLRDPNPFVVVLHDLEETARERVLDARDREIDPGGGRHLGERFETDVLGALVPLLGNGAVDTADPRRERRRASGRDDLVADPEPALVEDDVRDRADPLLIAPFEDRRLTPLGNDPKLFLQEPLRQSDQERDELRHADAGLGRNRDDADVPGQVAHPVVAFGGESGAVELLGHRVHLRVEEALEIGAPAGDLLEQGRRARRLAPPGDQVDLGEGDRERRFFAPEDLD